MTKKFMQKPEFIILSAELSNLTELENLRRTANLRSCLNDLKLSYKEVDGCYKGSTENSFMVIIPDEATFEVVRDLALKSFNQESILFRDYAGKARLEYQNGDTIELGSFKEVSKEQATSEDAYTVVNGAYWVVA